jgi:hypothetical protein
MPALAPVVGVARVVVRGTANGQPIVNVFHVQNGSLPPIPYTAAGILALATAFGTTFAAQFATRLNQSYSGDEVTAQDLSSVTGRSAAVALTLAASGSGTTTPQSAAACITWKIDRHYRGGHPRTYIGPLPSAAFESPISLAPTYVTALQNAGTALRTFINTTPMDGTPQTLVCVHRQRDGVQLAVPDVSPITSCAVDSRIDSMRRRLGPDR